DFVSREMLVGHNTGLDKSYYRPGTDELLSEYLRVQDLLTMDESNRLKIKVQELTAKTETDEYIIRAKLQEKDDQIQTLIMKQEKFEHLIQSLIESGQLRPGTVTD